MCGTYSYSAPELLEGKPYTQKADVWSVGSLYYEMICGKTPFQDKTVELILTRMR